MTINKPELRIINNTHQQETMAELKRLLDSKHMTQAELGAALKRDKTTINRWSKNSREITWDNAIKIAKVLNVHPVEVFQPRQEIVLDKYIDNKFIVKTLSKEEQFVVPIPFEFYKINVKAVQVNIPGNFLHREIFLFDFPKKKADRFSKFSVHNLCYVTCSKSWKKRTGKNNETIGIVRANEDGSMVIINPLTKEPVNENCKKVNIKDIDICVPVKAKYNPDLL
jgi:transcriptional regulator with XRE-family HTH domain